MEPDLRGEAVERFGEVGKREAWPDGVVLAQARDGLLGLPLEAGLVPCGEVVERDGRLDEAKRQVAFRGRAVPPVVLPRFVRLEVLARVEVAHAFEHVRRHAHRRRHGARGA